MRRARIFSQDQCMIRSNGHRPPARLGVTRPESRPSSPLARFRYTLCWHAHTWRIAAGLLTLALLFHAGTATAQTDDIWSATLTVKDLGASLGCESLSCNSNLTANSFIYGGVTYQVQKILGNLDSSQVLFLIFKLDKVIPQGSTLHVGSSSFPLADAALTSSNTEATWSNKSPNFVTGAMVSLKLTVPAATPPPPPPDTTPPRVSGTPVVTGDTLTLSFTERLRTGTAPPTTAFAVLVGDADPVHPTAVAVSGRAVTLTLATSIAPGDTVEVRYTRPDATGDRLRDGAGNPVRTFTRMVTNDSPAGQPRADPGMDLAVDPGVAVTLDGAGSLDPDGDTLTFAWTQVPDATVMLTGADTAMPSFTAPEQAGVLTFRLTVTDPDGIMAADTVTVMVRDAPPRFDEAPADLMLNLDRATDVVLPAASGGNGALTYSLTSDPAGLAGLTFDPASRTLTGTPTTVGSWTFTYRAEDADDNRDDADAARLTFTVTVVDTTPARKRFLTRTLAVMGAQTLSNALDTLGARFTETDPASSLTVGGQRLVLGTTGAAATTPVGRDRTCADAGLSLTGALACDRDETLRRASNAPSPSLGQILQASSFTLALGADGEAGAGMPAWTLWGRGGAGAFAGRPEAGSHFKGQTRTGWLGLDARAGAWVAGLAVSYDRTEADYTFAGGASPHDRGDLETTLTTLYPYGRWALSDSLDVRTILGAGRGTARHRLATGGPPETSDLSLWLGSVGLRQQLPPVAGFTLAARADASLVQLDTDAGEQALDGLTARSWRARLGLDATQAFLLDDGTALAPFVTLVGRYDGGDGFVGAGLEVAGGLRYTADRFQVEARGRLLVVHAQTGAEERGLSVTARYRPELNGEGLSLALAPRWGAATGDATTLWQHALPQTPGLPGTEVAALDAQIGYGVALARGVLTPFAEAGLAGNASRRMRLGTRYAVSRTALALELAGTRQERAGAAPVHGVRLDLTFRF